MEKERHCWAEKAKGAGAGREEMKMPQKKGIGVGAVTMVRQFFPQVKSVSDATKPVFINVNARDAASKAVKDHKECAMAVACKRQMHLDGVIISRSVAYLIKGTHATRFKVPPSVAREVVSFDRKAEFMLGKYELAAISPSIRLGVRQGDRPHTVRGNKSKRFRHITQNVRSVLGGEKEE